MARSSNPEDPDNQVEEAVEGFVQEAGYQLGWAGAASALAAEEVAKETIREDFGE